MILGDRWLGLEPKLSETKVEIVGSLVLVIIFWWWYLPYGSLLHKVRGKFNDFDISYVISIEYSSELHRNIKRKTLVTMELNQNFPFDEKSVEFRCARTLHFFLIFWALGKNQIILTWSVAISCFHFSS